MSTLIGCKSNDDLHAYIQEVNMRKGGRIAPLPEIKPERAMERKTGARALRSIVEDFMLDIMYDLPNRTNVEKCIVTKDVVESGGEPIYLEADRKSA